MLKLFPLLSALLCTEAFAAPVSCPSTDFNEFLAVYANSAAVQRTFTENGVKIGSTAMPLETERDKKQLSFIGKERGSTAEAKLYDMTSGFNKVYKFRKAEGCWRMNEIEDRSLIANGKVRSNWLEFVIPSIAECTPAAFFYDRDTARSNNGILEKLGYRPFEINSLVAKYKVTETFHGVRVSEVWIPSSLDSYVALILESNVPHVKRKIKIGSNEHIDAKPKNGSAYITALSRNRSKLVCETFEK